MKKFGLLSVNQLAAKIKLVEVWKSVHREGSPLTLEPYHQANTAKDQLNLRQQQNRVFNDTCRLKRSESSFHIDGARLWNAATREIRDAATLNTAKKAIEKFCGNLPV